MTPEQCLHARELLRWSRIRLASRAGYSEAALRSLETGQHRGIFPAYQSIRTVLEAAGVEFTNEETPKGVRLRGDQPLTPDQCRQARELLGWHQQRLAVQAKSCLLSVVGFEAGEKVTRPTTVRAFCAALEAAGVEFVPENGGGAGVRLRRVQER